MNNDYPQAPTPPPVEEDQTMEITTEDVINENHPKPVEEPYPQGDS